VRRNYSKWERSKGNGVGHGKRMSNHQYSPDKALVILDVSSEAGLRPRGGSEMDISRGGTTGVLQQSLTSFPIIPRHLYLPCLKFSTPTRTYLVVPLPHSPPPLPPPTTPLVTRSSIVRRVWDRIRWRRSRTSTGGTFVMPLQSVRMLTPEEFLALQEIIIEPYSDVLSVMMFLERTRVLFGRRDALGHPLVSTMSSSR